MSDYTIYFRFAALQDFKKKPAQLSDEFRESMESINTVLAKNQVQLNPNRFTAGFALKRLDHQPLDNQLASRIIDQLIAADSHGHIIDGIGAPGLSVHAKELNYA